MIVNLDCFLPLDELLHQSVFLFICARSVHVERLQSVTDLARNWHFFDCGLWSEAGAYRGN